MTDEHVLIMGGTVKAVVEFATRHRVELGITRREQIIAITNVYQLRGRRGRRLIVLQDCYHRAPHWYELIVSARQGGLEIEYRNCDEEVR